MTHLGQGQHHEGSSATGVHNHGHKFGVDRAEVAVPCHLGDSDVIVALVSFQSLAKDVTELTGSYNPPGHGELERKQALICVPEACRNTSTTPKSHHLNARSIVQKTQAVTDFMFAL